MENCKKSGKNQGKVREFRGGWQVATLSKTNRNLCDYGSYQNEAYCYDFTVDKGIHWCLFHIIVR